MRFLQVVDVKMRSLPTNCCGARLRLGSSGSLTAANTFGPNGLISRRIASATSFYTFDPLGNAANVINASGLLQFNCAYDAYGQPYGNATTLTYGYGAQYGYYRDSEATTSDNLLLCTYRWYDPGTARWLTRDPIGYAGGSNLYGYVGGNPGGGVDPLGLAAYLVKRPVHLVLGVGTARQSTTHWYIVTDDYGVVGYGPSGTMWGFCPDPSKPNNLGYPDWDVTNQEWTRLDLSDQQQQSLMQIARNVEKGWVMEGRRWRGDRKRRGEPEIDEYDWKGLDCNGRGTPNCQDYVNALLRKVGGTVDPNTLGLWMHPLALQGGVSCNPGSYWGQ
jgi:RHS repeat-associated protein